MTHKQKRQLDPKVKEKHRRNWWSFALFVMLVVLCATIHMVHKPTKQIDAVEEKNKKTAIEPLPPSHQVGPRLLDVPQADK